MTAATPAPAPAARRNAVGARDFTDAAALMANYAAVNARIWGARPLRPAVVHEVPAAILDPDAGTRVAEDEPYPSDGDTGPRAPAVDDGPTTPMDIVRRVAREHGLTLADLRGANRCRPVTAARWAAIAALREAYPRAALPQIGMWLRKDHTTILHALRRMGLAASPVTQDPDEADGAPEPIETPRAIASRVAKARGVSAREVLGGRTRRFALAARQEAIAAVCVAFPDMTRGAVAAVFRVDPTTVGHAVRSVAARASSPPPPDPQEPRP